MADWHSIKVVFDEPLSPEQLTAIEDEMVAEDYDFPRCCLRDNSFTPYRSPMDGGIFISKVFLEHGAKGQYWMTSNRDAYGEEACHDEDVVVFRPGVDPDSIRNASRLKNKLKYFQDQAARYIALCKAFGVDPLPVRWDVLPLLYINVMEADRGLFEEAVLKVQDQPQSA